MALSESTEYDKIERSEERRVGKLSVNTNTYKFVKQQSSKKMALK